MGVQQLSCNRNEPLEPTAGHTVAGWHPGTCSIGGTTAAATAWRAQQHLCDSGSIPLLDLALHCRLCQAWLGAWACVSHVVCSSRRLLWFPVPGVLGAVAQEYKHHVRKLQIIIQDLLYRRISGMHPDCTGTGYPKKLHTCRLCMCFLSLCPVHGAITLHYGHWLNFLTLGCSCCCCCHTAYSASHCMSLGQLCLTRLAEPPWATGAADWCMAPCT